MISTEYDRTRHQPMFLGDKQIVESFIKDHKDQVDLSYCDAVCRCEFTFHQPWDMEKCMEPVIFESEIDWTHLHNNDPEWMWMLNRHHFWIPVIQAYAATGDNKYISTVLKQWEHWLDTQKNPDGKKLTTWRTIDAGIRLRNWVKLLDFLIDSEELSDSLLHKILESIQIHISYLLDHYKKEYSLTNWRILEFNGVFLASVFVSSKSLWEKALEILEECICLQVTGDGFHWEQSYMYHVEMLLCMTEVIFIGERHGIEIPGRIKEVTKKMADAMVHMITPNKTQLCHGDSDVEDLSELLAGLAFVFGEKTYWYFAPAYPPVAAVFDYGSDFLKAWEYAEKKAPEQTDYAHEDVGNYFVRTGWGPKDSYLFFKNGFLGSGHGHCDLLHFEIIVKGVPVLVDSGRFTYREDTPKRQQYKAGNAHNTILADGEEFTVQKGSWNNSKVATAIKRPFAFCKNAAYLQGAHLGYLEKGIFVNRKIIYIKPHIWFIIDECFTRETHTFRQLFHFAKDRISLEGCRAVYEDGGERIYMELLGEGTLSKEMVEISPGYNHSYPSARVAAETTGKGTLILPVVFLAETNSYRIERIPVTNMFGTEVQKEFVSGWKIWTDEKTFLVFTNHQEEPEGRKQYLIDGNVVYGRTGIIFDEDGKVETEILEY